MALRRTLRTIVALTLTALLIVAFTASAVANNGNGQGNGNNACDAIVSEEESIQDAIDAADDGDTVCVEPGSYEGPVLIDVADLTLRSTDGASETVIDPQGAPVAIQVFANLGEVTVDGFTVLEDWVAAGIGQGLASSEGTAFHVLNNVVTAPVETTQHGNAIQVTGNGSTVVGNTVAVPHQVSPDWSGSGILVFGADDTLVQGNDVTSSPDDYCIAIAGDDFGAPPAHGNMVVDNSVQGCGIGVLLQKGAHDTTVEGNEIRDNAVGVYVHPVDDLVPTDNSVRFNDIVGNEVGIQNDAEGETLDANNNYWGHASGPSGPDGRVNPAGREVGEGDSIVGDVSFDDWLRQSISHPSRR